MTAQEKQVHHNEFLRLIMEKPLLLIAIANIRLLIWFLFRFSQEFPRFLRREDCEIKGRKLKVLGGGALSMKWLL